MLPLMIVKSPRCDDLVTLPAGLTPETRVRCPYTKEEFLIQEILDSLPPMLEVIDAPAMTTMPAAAVAEVEDAIAPSEDTAETRAPDDAIDTEATGESGETAVAEEADEAAAPAGDPMFDFLHGAATTAAEEESATDAKGPALFEPAGEDAESAAGGFDFGGETAAAGTAESTAAPARKKIRPRPKKKPKNALVEIVKVALGGIGGLLIAQLILFWAVPPGCSANPDPLGIAPSLPWPVSLVVPERLRESDEGADATPSTGGDGATTQQNNGQQDPQAATALDTPEVMGTPFAKPGEDTTSEDGGGGPTGEDEIAALNVDLPGIEMENESDPDGLGDLEIEDPLESLPKAAEPTVLGVRNPPVFDGPQLDEALKAAKDQQEEMEALGGLDGKGMRDVAAFYLPFCNLAERTTYVDPNGQQVKSRVEAVEDLLKKVGQSGKDLNALGAVTEYWLDMTGPRKSDGILIAGTVRRIEPRGKLHGTSVEILGTDERVVMVLSRIAPQSKLKEGDRVIILGAMVKNPGNSLGGYEGSEAEVVWGGLPVALPKAGGGRRGRSGGDG